jgi:hypothetical protein
MRFAGDLREAGIAGDGIAWLYERALLERSDAAWERFYRATFRALGSLARPRSRSSVESLLRLVADDFGWRLFGGDAIELLRASLLFRVDRTIKEWVKTDALIELVGRSAVGE